MLRRVLLCATALAVSACTPTPERPLKAVLFPYIPDSAGDGFASLKQALEKDFELRHPDIDLNLVLDGNLDLYDLKDGGTLNQLLGPEQEAAQLVEIDTLILGELVSKGWIQPLPVDATDTFPAARQAVSIEGKNYGMPTYLCTNVVYAGSPGIQSATDGQSLVQLLSDLGPGKRPLAANYDGSWTLPYSYMDAWADTHPADHLSQALALPLDEETLGMFDEVVDSCALEPGVNPCLDGTYADNTLAEEAFATGQANAFMGYTERLFFIRKANPHMALPEVISVPLGAGTHPLVFVDALVLNSHCTAECLEDARTFAEYMGTPEVRTLIAFSQDGSQGTLPRYLLQASQSFYQRQPASSEPMYLKYAPIISNARSYPNQGFPENRKRLQAALLEALGRD